MKKVFIDTAAWLALINIDDDFHKLAIKIRKKLQEEGYQFITSDFIFLEVADALTSPHTRQKTINFINRFKNLPNLEVIPVSDSLFQRGWKLYCQRLDKDWGLTDCISFTIMQKQKISLAFTSDKHFQQAGFIRLLLP
jgi:uncharacterized protein